MALTRSEGQAGTAADNDLIEEILTSDQYRLIEQVKFTYFPLGKAFEKQIKTIEDKRRKQVEALKVLKTLEHQQKPESI